MGVDPELLQELLDTPVGPKVASKPEVSDLVREVSISQALGTASIEVAIDPTDVNEGTALRFLEDEGLTPAEWEVTNFRKIEYGVGLQSVRFSYKRVGAGQNAALSADVIAACRKVIEDAGTPETYALDSSGVYVVLIADPQFGKKGTQQAVENYKRGVLAHLERADLLINLGAVGQIHLAWMGDESEGVANNYANQAYTIELNQSEQLELDYELRVWALKEAMKLGAPVSASSVISNHGEWTRNGSKDVVTSKGDNASTYVARQVKALFDELEPFTGQRIEWAIGEDSSPGISLTLGGVECYFSHGYIEKGKGGSTELRTKSAIERQILGKTEELGSTSLWFMAHYHHFYTNEFEGRTLFGCPALEAEKSSEYMLEQFGVWSPAGLLGMVVSDASDRGWSDVNVF